MDATSMICKYALKLSIMTLEDVDVVDEDKSSKVRSSSASWPEKECEERRKRGLGSKDHAEKAVMKPVG